MRKKVGRHVQDWRHPYLACRVPSEMVRCYEARTRVARCEGGILISCLLFLKADFELIIVAVPVLSNPRT